MDYIQAKWKNKFSFPLFLVLNDKLSIFHSKIRKNEKINQTHWRKGSGVYRRNWISKRERDWILREKLEINLGNGHVYIRKFFEVLKAAKSTLLYLQQWKGLQIIKKDLMKAFK